MLTDKQIEYLKETFLCYIAEDRKEYDKHFIKRAKISVHINSEEFDELCKLSDAIFFNPYFDRFKNFTRGEQKWHKNYMKITK